MATAREIAEKMRKKKQEENKTSTSAKTSAKEVAERIKKNGHIQTEIVDQKYIDSYFSDAKKFAESSQKDYESMGWGNASSVYNSKSSAVSDLNHRESTIRAWLDQNKDKFDEDAYNGILSSLDEYNSGIGNIFGVFEKAWNTYSKFETEAEYKDALKVSGFYSMSSKEIESYLSSVETEIDKYETELLELENNIMTYNLDGKSTIKTYEENLKAEDRVAELKKKIKELQDSTKIAHTTVGGQNILWQDLYDTKKAEEGFNSLYNEFSTRPNWEEQSKYITTNPEGVTRANSAIAPSVDWDYEDVNKYGLQIGQSGVGIDRGYAEVTTPEEKALFNYIYHEISPEDALKWHESRKDIYEQRVQAKILENVAQFSKDYPGLASAVSIFTSLTAPLEYSFDVPKYLFTGELDDNTMSRITTTIRGTVSDETNWMIGNWDAHDFLYNSGMSMLESFIASKIPYVGGVVLGMSAASSATNDALDRGMDNSQAFWAGAAAGGFETLFESWSIGKFKSMQEGVSSGGKAAMKNIAKSMLVNASEETLTEIANIVYDTVANGDFSSYETSIRQYMSAGMSESEAKSQVAKELGIQVAEAAGSGALMGIGFGGIAEGGKAVKATLTGRSIKKAAQSGDLQISDIADVGRSLGEGTESYRLADKITDKSSAYAIGALYGIEGVEISEANRGDIVKSLERKGYDTKTATQIADIMLNPKSDAYASVALQNPQTFSDIILNPNSTVSQRTNPYTAIKSAVAESKEARKSGKKATPKAEDIEKVAKEYEAKGLSPEEAKAMAVAQLSQSGEVQSSPAEETAVESKYEIADDGKTTNLRTGDTAEVINIESISADGEARLTLDNKTVAKASDIAFGSPAQATFIENIGAMKLGKTPISTASANLLYNAAMSELKSNPNMTENDAMSLIRGLADAYIHGAYNFGMEALTEKDEKGSPRRFAGELSQTHREYAYNLGVKDSISNVEADQKAVDKVVSKAKAKSKAKKAHLGKVIFESQIDENSLTQTKKANLNGIKLLAELTNYEIHVFESDENYNFTMPNGAVRSANGWYVSGTNQIWIDLNAGNAGEGTMMWTAAHEISHDIKRKSPKQWKAMADLVMKTFAENGENIEGMLNRQKEKIKKRYTEKDMPSDAEILELAYEELVCDALTDMLTDGSIVNFIAEVKAKDKNLAQRILDSIKSLLKKWGLIVDSYKGRDLDTLEAQALSKYEDVFKKLQEMYRDALMDADSVTAVANDIVNIDADSKSVAPMMSERTWTESEYVAEREKTAKAISKSLGVDIETAYKYIDDINSVARLIADDRVRLDYDPNIDEGATVLKPNSDYKYSVDMSTLCAKRLLTTGTFDAIQRKLPNTVFTSEDIVALREMMLKRGYEVACGICYVESTRREMGRITQDFINSYIESQKTGKPITRINSSGKAVELRKTIDEKASTVDKTTDKFYAEKDYTPTLADLNTTDIDVVKKEHPLVYEAYLNFMNARGQAKPKLLETRAEYKGEILKHFKTKTAVNARNNAGGLRLQSFSDFEVPHLIDMMQIVMDMSRVGLKSQAYTKVPAFAEVFGNTGVKINLSLIAKGSGLDANGNLIFDDVEGINHEEAFKLREKFSKNVGTILVGKTDAHIIAAMADPRIDYIIPFHKSSWKESLYEALGLTGYADYTDTQNEKPIDKDRKIKNFDPSEYWDFTKSGDENAQIYLEMCRKDGRIPKFPQFQGYPGYWKLLIDFKMYDNDGVGSPQEAVTPTFEMDSAEKILNEYKGGHRSFPVAKDVVEDFVSGYEARLSKDSDDLGKDALFSERDSRGHKLSEAQIEFFKDSKVRDEKGRLLAVYHGTKHAGFTKFTKTDEIGYFFARTLRTAQTYSNHSKTIYAPDRYTETAVPDEANYQVYLNIKNPYIIDGKGVNWNGLEATGEKVQISIKTSNWGDDGKGLGRITFKYGGRTYSKIVHNMTEFDAFITKHLNAEMSSALAYAMNGVVDKNGKGKFEAGIAWDFKNSKDAETKNTRDIVRRAYHSKWNYDGVIFRNVVDSGDGSKIKADDLYVAFNSNQIKSTANTEPTPDPDIRYQERDPSASNRGILANALESAAQNDIERKKLEEYKKKISLIEAEESRLAEIQRKLFTKGEVDPTERKALQFEAKQIANRINTYDRQLLTLESTAALKGVLNREKALAAKRQKQRDAEILRKAKERAAETQRELMTRYQESRKKATESRHRTEMRHKIQRVVAELNTLLTKGNKKKHIPEELKVAVADVLELFNMDTVGADERVAKYDALIAKAKDPDVIASLTETRDRIQKQGDKFSAKLDKLKSAYETIRTSADPEIAGGFDEAVTNRIQYVANKVGKTSLRDMTLEQLEDVYDVYTMVLNNIREANTLFKKDKAETIQNISSRVIGETKQAGGEHEYTSPRTKGIKTFLWNNLKPVFAFEKIGSKTLTDLFKDVRKGEDTWAVDVEEATEFAESQYKKRNYKKWDLNKKYHFKTTTGESFSLTLEQMMSLYAFSKRPQADDHLTIGGFVFDSSITVHKEKGLDDDGKTKKSILKYEVNTAKAHQISKQTLAEIISNLTSEQRAFVDEMQAYLSDVMGAKGNEVSMTLYGIRLFKEKFYFPLKSAKQFMFEQNEVAGEVRIKNSGFTESTVEHANNPIILTNFMDVWANHVNDMSMYHSFVVPLENFNRVFNYQTRRAEGMPPVSVKGTIQNAYGRQAVEYIRQLLTDLNGGARSDPRETFAKKLTSTFKKAKVFVSNSVVIQQPSAVARALALIDARYFDYNPKLISHNKLWAELKKYAPVAIIKEMGRFDTDMGLSTAEYIKGQKTFFQKAEDWLSKAPAVADELTWVHIWTAVKRETQAKHKELKVGSEEFLKTAGERFTEVVMKTQVYDSVLSRSANMRSKSALMSMATAFLAEGTTAINMVENAFGLWQRGYKRTALKQLKGVSASVILNAALVSIVYAMRDDDEDETFLEKYLSSFVTETADGFNPLTYIPWVKDVWSLLQGYSVERTDMSLFSDIIDAFKGFTQTAISYDEEMTEEEEQEFKDGMRENAWKLVDGIAAIFGIPAGNIRRDIESYINTYNTLNNGASTSKSSLKDEMTESVKDITPVWGWWPDKSKGDKLYDAIVSGDTDYVDRLKNGYKDEKAYENALRKALRENDPRIKEAAEARYAGNNDEYMRIAKEIKAEGNFSQDTIVAAINAEISKLKPKEESESSSPAFLTLEDYYKSLLNGDTYTAQTIKDELVAEKLAEGYLQHEAEDLVATSLTSRVKSEYMDGNITRSTATAMISEYGGMTYGGADTEIKKCDFELEYGLSWSERARGYRLGKISKGELISAVMDIEGEDYQGANDYIRFLDLEVSNPNTDITASDAKGYFEYAEPAGININVYLSYKEKTSGLTGDKDANGKTINGSKKNKVLAVINSLPISNAQKDALYYANGWSAKTINEAPWH